ncbi:MAG: hypothetical protein ISEC1_P1509 [Thiomicrorhabdus sp.]|nr:MAG: hypothetical protein ISEC1_P1509 [Thiomicrorhabdus sp.]
MVWKASQKQKGFTLVEIVIVLVIIGLLLGGVLKGQELITNAKIKSVTDDFSSISTAYYAYRDREGHLAGDGTTASPRIYDNVITDPLFWFDLRTAGFITGAAEDGATDTGPIHSFEGVWTALPAGGLFSGANHICASGVEDVYAKGMDIKMDDGDATAGSIRSGTDAAATVALPYTAVGTLVTVCKEL